ncbi:TnsD family Tn7-like transposition protein [Geomonas edaphica]|uniref:TnsD family Tn7-like transposition protein n=1 Tax=Geomonas edaphica TaxID=2570226 RepID=UPI0010A7B109|nr:TnsD family Tn7-like transposition protein [Geomonas edaphica]
MNIYLPQPYPDELFYSVVARYITYSSQSQYKVCFDLLDHYVLNPFLPQGLRTASKRTWAGWHMTGEEIALLLTMYPFYRAFTSSFKKDRMLASLLENNNTRFYFLPKDLRYCPTCKKNDIASYSETYWKRIHQMKGVAVCPDHGDLLVSARLPHRICASSSTEPTLHGQTAAPTFTQDEKVQLLAIARRCRNFLNYDDDSQWGSAGPRLYQKIAMEKGFCTGPMECERQIVQKFKEMYSSVILNALGEHSDAEEWIKQIFFSEVVIINPVAHAVAQEFLTTLPNDSDKAILFGPGPWKCPNPYGQHSSQYPIKRVTTVRDKHKKLYATAICCCGFSFAFYTTGPSDISLPQVHRVIHYGPTWEDEIRKLNRAGIENDKIAHLLKISIKTVGRVLSGLSLSNSSHITLRRQWDKVIESAKNHNKLEAGLVVSKLFKKLKKVDPNYLLCHSPGSKRYGARYYEFMPKGQKVVRHDRYD